MKLYLITRKRVDYEDMETVLIRAAGKARARSLAAQEWTMYADELLDPSKSDCDAVSESGPEAIIDTFYSGGCTL